jgi:hypothetical protein
VVWPGFGHPLTRQGVEQRGGVAWRPAGRTARRQVAGWAHRHAPGRWSQRSRHGHACTTSLWLFVFYGVLHMNPHINLLDFDYFVAFRSRVESDDFCLDA